MALDKYAKERLLKVAEILEELPKKRKFDLDLWFGSEPGKCGTTACAVGHASEHPWFRKRGLRHDVYAPTFNNTTEWNAVERFFHIENDSAEHLFSDAEYKRGNRYDVIRRIRKFVKNDGAV